MPEISVVMIFLNPGKFFREAIESVQAQTFTDWELLLVDDGSTDGSTALAQQFANAHPERIYYLSHPEHEHRGMSASRNLGLAHARGRFLALLDSDDVWHPDYLSAQFDVLAKWPTAAASFANTRIWFSWAGDLAESQPDRNRHSGPIKDELVEPGFLIPMWLREQESTPATCSILMRTDAARKHKFDESFESMFEDQVFVYKVALSESVFVASYTLSYYRQHSGSTCHIKQLNGAYHPCMPNRAELNFLNWLKNYLVQEHIQIGAIDDAVQFRLKQYNGRPSELFQHIWKLVKRCDWRRLRWHKVAKNGRRIASLLWTAQRGKAKGGKAEHVRAGTR